MKVYLMLSMKIRIQHVPGSVPPSFRVFGPAATEVSDAIAIESPSNVSVESRPQTLLHELQWYLERFMDYPLPPETEHADRVLRALNGWGEQIYKALLAPTIEKTGPVTAGVCNDLYVEVASDDARVLSWPWEAIRDS